MNIIQHVADFNDRYETLCDIAKSLTPEDEMWEDCPFYCASIADLPESVEDKMRTAAFARSHFTCHFGQLVFNGGLDNPAMVAEADSLDNALVDFASETFEIALRQYIAEQE